MLQIFQLNWTNPKSFSEYYVTFYKIFIKNKIDPTPIMTKLIGNEENKCQFFYRLLKNIQIFDHFHLYYEDLYRRDKNYKGKYEHIIEMMFSLCIQFKKLMRVEERILNLQCLIITNIFFFLAGSYGKYNAINFLLEKISTIYFTFIDKQKNPNFEIIRNSSNCILIVDQLLIMLMGNEVSGIKEIETYISSKIKIIFRFIFLVLPCCEPYYKSRLEVKYY